MLSQTPVIVLHRYPYSESSWIVKALSPDLGVLSLLVKGGKGKDSPFRTSLDPLSYSEVVLNHNPRKDLHIPREASLRQWFPRLRTRLADMAVAQVMAEILLRMAALGGHFPEEYLLLRNALELLEQSSATPDFLARWLYALSETLGYGLALDTCVQCNTSLHSGPADVWPALGGGVCPHCLGSRRPAYSAEFLKEIAAFTQKQPMDANASTWIRLENFFLHYLRVHTGALEHLHSWSWLGEVRRLSS
jgi:DNA repair protein RecO (recombination protein O)